MRTRTVLISALVALLAAPATAASAAPADTAPPQVKSIELSLADATVSGLETVPMTVRVRLTDDGGVRAGNYMDAGWAPSMGFDVSGVSAWTNLQLAEGTPQDGIWTGTVLITSAWSGVVQPNSMYLADLAGHVVTPDPRTVIPTPGVNVHSSHHPKLSIAFSPQPALADAPVTEQISALDSDTGQPWSHLALSVGYDSNCPENYGGTPVTTGFFGTVQQTIPPAATSGVHCAFVLGPSTAGPDRPVPAIIAVTAADIALRYLVTAKPAHTSVRAGTNVNVTGSVLPAGAATVDLQRLAGKSWITVTIGKATYEGTYKLIATPPGKATYRYRVLAQAPGIATNTSPVFTITGT